MADQDDPGVRPIPVATPSSTPAGRRRQSGDDEVVTVDTRGRRSRHTSSSAQGASDGVPLTATRAMPVGAAARRPAAASASPSARSGSTATATAVRPPNRSGGLPVAAPKTSPDTHRGRRVVVALAVLLLLVLGYLGSLAWAATSSWNAVHRVAATPTVGNRPSAGSGTNYLLVGSDSRAGLTKAQIKKYATGVAAGQRTDSIMLIHRPASGEPTLVSIPRDSYVSIRGHGRNKVNAAFAYGGPKLLVDTVEQATGLRIDGYVEVGFAGFASVVDSLGGVSIKVKFAMNDKKAGINLKKGTQLLDGKNALGYVRARYSDPLGDLGRVQRQRQFLGALMTKAATPSNVLLPWRLHSIGTAGAAALTVGNDDSMLQTARAFLALRSVAQGNGQSVTVPISNPGLQTAVGDVVVWNSTKAKALFSALRTDTPLSATP